MARELGVEQYCNAWILHYDSKKNDSWKHFYQMVAKNHSQIGYFGVNDISQMNSSRWISPSNGLTLNLYLSQNWVKLNQIFNEEKIHHERMSNDIHEGKLVGQNIWLIQMSRALFENASVDFVPGATFKYHKKIFSFVYHQNGIIRIYYIYKDIMDSKPIWKRFSTWSPKFGIQTKTPDIWSMLPSLNGLHIRVVSAYSPPSVTYIEDNCSKTRCFQGMYADVWNALSNKMNFTYTVQRVYEWGSLEDGTWSGMVGMLVKNQVDIAVTDFIMTKDRSTAVDFLPSIEEQTTELYIRTPDDILLLDAYIEPMTHMAWIGVFLMMIIVPLVLAAMGYYEGDKSSRELKLGHFYKFVAQTLTMHETEATPTTYSNTIAFLCVFLGGVVIYYYWEAMLLSYLAVRKIQLPFKTLSDLAETSKYKLFVGQGTAHLDQFKHSNTPLFKRIWKDKIEPHANDLPLYVDLEKAILDDPHSAAYSEVGIQYGEAYLSCKIITTGAPVSNNKLAWAIPKESPLAETIGYNFKKIKEIGVIQRFSTAYLPPTQVCPNLSGRPLTMNQCISAFIILAIGFIACIILVCLEGFIPARWMRWNNNL